MIGLSGGLDSTLALLVSLEALKRLDLPKSALCALTLPGPGTSEKTLGLVGALAEVLGLALERIDIGPAVALHLADLGHDGVTPDLTFENAQARERTQILFDRANHWGLVVGTGDLSELALGWCTFNADHMASYNVNGSVPKTLIADLVRAMRRGSITRLFPGARSGPRFAHFPELIPGEDPGGGPAHGSGAGPYEVHDFYLYYALRFGMGPAKLRFLARRAFADRHAPEALDEWLDRFLSRFHAMQFKRTMLPPGPKVGTVSLSLGGIGACPERRPPALSARRAAREVRGRGACKALGTGNTVGNFGQEQGMAMQAKARCLLRRIGRPAVARIPLQRRSEPGKVHPYLVSTPCV